MKKGITPIKAILFTGLLILAAGVLTAADVPDNIAIENSGYDNDKLGPVNLNHLEHNTEYGIECTECHHEYVDGQNVWKEDDPVKKCVECHDPNKSEGDVKKLQTAFHNNCRNCHKEVGGEAPTTKCTDCHSKKK